MPGFRNCSWCDGAGCMCCDGERAKWEKAEAARKERHANRTADQIRADLKSLRALKGEGDDLNASIARMMGGTVDVAAVDREIARDEHLLDLEYHRQFPDGPKPIFSANLADPFDVELLKTVAHRDVLEKAFGEGGGGIAEIERLATEARAAQAAGNSTTTPKGDMP